MTLLDHFPWAKHKPSEEPTTPQERGRPLVSSGRGGAGNIRVASKQAENDTPPPQFRIANAHVGRGGVGNVRSPSRDPLERAKLDQEEQHNMQVEDQLQEEQLRNRVHLLGRGGSGNLPRNISPADEQRGRTMSPARGKLPSMLRSMSRSRSREPSEVVGNDPLRAEARSTSTLDQVLESTTEE